MKAHIVTHKPTALLWNFSENQEGFEALRTALNHAGMHLKPVNNASLSSCVGDLCDLPGRYKKGPPAPAADFPPALILQGLNDTVLDQLLAELREKNVIIPLKAVVTDTNRSWPLCELLAELCQEHEAFQNQK